MRRPASLCMHTDAREATGNPPSAITSGREELAGPVIAERRQRREAFIPRGPDANKPPRWSAERRASPGAQTVKASLRGDARTVVFRGSLRSLLRMTGGDFVRRALYNVG